MIGGISAIEKDLAVLSSSSASEQEQLESLEFLGHWGGDIHQLHVSFEDDRGGNSIGVSGGLCSWDLHAVWDGCIIEQGLPGDPHSVARDLLDEVTDEDRAAWRASGPLDWANESFVISVSPEVRYCVATDSGCWYDAQNPATRSRGAGKDGRGRPGLHRGQRAGGQGPLGQSRRQARESPEPGAGD